MPLTNLLGVAFTLLTTNFHAVDFKSVSCLVPGCSNIHHWAVIEIFRVNRETRVPVVIDGLAVERVLDVVPLSAIYVTNYVSDLRAAQSRARVPPMPLPMLPPRTNSPAR